MSGICFCAIVSCVLRDEAIIIGVGGMRKSGFCGLLLCEIDFIL